MRTFNNLQILIKYGVLLDVTHLARGVGILCPTFVTAAFWQSVEISENESYLAEALDFATEVHELLGEGRLGSTNFHVAGRLCPWVVSATALVAIFEGLGKVLIVGELEEELDFRGERTAAGGSFFTV